MKICRSCPASHSASNSGIRRTKSPKPSGLLIVILMSLPMNTSFQSRQARGGDLAKKLAPRQHCIGPAELLRLLAYTIAPPWQK